MANEARFYWSMKDRAVDLYRKSDNDKKILDKVQDECCKLVNEFRCPRLIHIEAWVSLFVTLLVGLVCRISLIAILCAETPFQMLSIRLLVCETSAGLRA